ncbi:MAG TPA: VWA domain-containing protein [Pyrinomonadaceae bacterium]|jgi:VWFA-related protein|nr:VWA domain-containing protein [Pyrinomonadaceae bacterium]
MKNLAGLLLTFALLAHAVAQQTAPAREDEDEVVRITSNLIQVDAVVLDAEGRQVTGLGPEDFELLEDGRPRSITHFSYVSNEAGDATVAAAASNKVAATPSKAWRSASVPPARIRRGGARRVVAFVVDDLGLDFQAAAYVREFLKRFVEREMRPGDLVAFVRTSAGVGALQQFTSDPRLAAAAVERIRFRPGFRAPTGAFAVPGGETGEQALDSAAPFTVGTLGALNYVLRGAAELPGRKSVVLISGDTRVFRLNRRDASVRDFLQRMADLANRASASVYTLDASDLTPGKLGSSVGLVSAAGTSTSQAANAQGSDPLTSGRPSFTQASNQSLAEVMFNDRDLDADRAQLETASALRYLAKQTGGAQVFDAARVIEDQRGYYLIGFRPSETTFDARPGGGRFHNITVRVKRPGLRVRHRVGFYATTDGEAPGSGPSTREGKLLKALTSPLASGAIGVSLTPLFGNDAQTGSFVRALVHVDARNLKFAPAEGGTRQASFEVLAVTLGEGGKPLDQVSGVETVRVSGADYERLLKDGFRYTLKVPVKKPGAYQLRVAVLDHASELTGSANELIDVPDLSGGRLTVSGLVLSGKARADAPAGPAAELEMEADAAVRRLRAGMELRYDFVVYNAQPDPSTGLPRLQTQVRLFRDGRVLYEGKVAPFETAQREDLGRLRAGGRIALSRAAAPGEYVLQVIVTDLSAREDRRVATRWIDFEIVR